MKFSSQQYFRICVLITATILITYFCPRHEQSHYTYEVGRPWSYAQLIAPFDMPIRPDSASIRRAADSIRTGFIPFYRRDEGVVSEMIDSMNRHLGAGQAQAATEILDYYYSRGVLPAAEERTAAHTRTDSLRFISRGNVISRQSTGHYFTIERLQQAIATLAGPQDDAEKVFRLGSFVSMLKPNLIYDKDQSDMMFEQAMLPFVSASGVIQKGQSIINKGHIITEQDHINLQTYEDMMDREQSAQFQSNILLIIGQCAFVLLVLVILSIYLRNFEYKVYESRNGYLAIILLVTLFFLFAVTMNHFIDNGIYLVPFTIVPILILVFFDGRTAMFAHILEIILCASFAPFTLEFIFLQLSAGCAAVFSLEKQISKRAQLLRTAAVVAATYLISYLAMELLLNGSFDGISKHITAFLLINSVLISFAYILMFVFEKLFGFISVVTLVELADINHPLLRQLSDECPGTFQHSMAVSNLASDAAARIGANVQLVRAGALYHDIGKLNNPAFFTENQSGVNPHEALPPEKSAQIVINHVSDGIRRAEKAKLPTEIIDFIREHHGAGKAKYFYYNFCKQHPDTEVDCTPFTYPGPNPKSKETSIMMMADAVEAASRSLSDHSPEALSSLVNKIIDGQIAEGLHNDSPLSFSDIQTIKEAFIRRLQTMYHSRITYPEAPKA
ncbi:MAG: HDIG domain-containing protein [Muribaculaceae bacterium]|nr:HDIG domain-containing protein [Muribaculaceae bacterium]